ncbi:MAG: Polysaccharide biosynthesis protein, membrane-associated [Methanomicrobiales archaeon 53_19]|nr:MAG: Polysaccharide biosynthesis protein, membrane-associated [Methanocalculus sp. 52_23]KUL02860.1 MAG: Polysaccharide biosynthesis protein, membrane-associated [Methanomicrobiales archaeon 53_19]
MKKKIIEIYHSKTRIDVQWAFFSLLSAGLTYIVLRIIIGKNLGVSGLGIYTIVYMIYQFGIQFSNFGFGSALTKYIAENYDDKSLIQKKISAGIVGSIISGLIFSILLFIMSPIISNNVFNTPEMNPLLIITSFCFPFISLQLAVLGIFNGFRQMKSFASLNIVLNVFIIFLSIYFVNICNLSLFGAVLGYAIPTCIIGGLSPLLLSKEFTFKRSLFEVSVLKTMSIFGFFFILSTSASFLNTQVGTFLIGYFLTPIEVGIYSVAITISQILIIFPSAIQRITTPDIANLYRKKSETKIRKYFFRSMSYSLIACLIIGIIIILMGDWLILNLFSEEFLPAKKYMIYLIIGNVIFSPVISVGSCFFSMNKFTVPYRINIISFFLMLLLNFILIPSLGIFGAVISTITLQIVLLFIYFAMIWIYTAEE